MIQKKSLFADKYQGAFLNLYNSIVTKQPANWEEHVENGYIKRIHDPDIRVNTSEIVSTNVNSTFITCPKSPKDELGIKLPFLTLVVKYIKKYFTVEIHVLDDANMRRRIHASNYQSKTCVKPFLCTLPMRLDTGWNQLQFNLPDLVKRAYGTNYVETLRIIIYANCRVRRVYYTDRLYTEDEMPSEYRLISTKTEEE